MKKFIMLLAVLVLAGGGYYGYTTYMVVGEKPLTVADVHAKRVELAGKQISITGNVVKVNNGIMKRNFIHVQDGTGTGDTDRLIFTSTQTANVGDRITASGVVVLDTDFTMGYVYPTLVEKATLTPAK
jgi:hypothetical protein